MNIWWPYIVAILVGLLVGIEREKSQPKNKTMGVRTFLCICLLGAISGGGVSNWLAILLSAFTLGLILISYFTQTNKVKDVDRGLTTEFAAGIVYCLGYISHQSLMLPAIIGPIVAVVLFSKGPLHRFTKAIQPAELKASLLLLLGAVVVVNLAPDQTVDPWGIFNPRRFGYLVLILAVLEFFSYAVVKIIGEKKGVLIVGFLGGLVSSTAVLLFSARQSLKNPKAWRSQFTSILAAKITALLEVLFILALVSPLLFQKIVWPIGGGVVLALIILIGVVSKDSNEKANFSIRSPLDWRGVLRLSIILALILAGISAAQHWLGDSGMFVLSFLTGLFELHGVSLANATMFAQQKIALEAATAAILLATLASLVAKICMVWLITRGFLSRMITVSFVAIGVAIAVIGWIVARAGF